MSPSQAELVLFSGLPYIPLAALQFCRSSEYKLQQKSPPSHPQKAGFGVLTYSAEVQLLLHFALFRTFFASSAVHLKKFCSGGLVCSTALKMSPLFTYLLFYSRNIYWVIFIWQQENDSEFIVSLLLKQKVKQTGIIL